MDEVYEYRMGGRSRTSWLAAIAIAALISFSAQNQSPLIFGTIWGLAIVMIAWLLTRKPMAGIQIDQIFLTLSAWHNPRQIPLTDIAHLRMNNWSDDHGVSIVYHDGTEEVVPSGDLPPIQRLSEEMADRGIEIRDPASQAFRR